LKAKKKGCNGKFLPEEEIWGEAVISSIKEGFGGVRVSILGRGRLDLPLGFEPKKFDKKRYWTEGEARFKTAVRWERWGSNDPKKSDMEGKITSEQ